MFTWRAQRVEKEAGRRQTKHLPNAEEEGTTIYSGESGEIATEVATEAVEEDSRRASTVRGHPNGENPCSSGADLHTDKMDGGFRFGGCILFCGDGEEGQNQWHDFAILEGPNGGRGAALRVLRGDWICALCCRYNSKLHGTVFEDFGAGDASQPSQPTAPPPRPVEGPVRGLHVVSYNLGLIEKFIDRVGTSAAAEQRVVVGKLDRRLRSIALGEVWHAKHPNR